MPILNLNNLFNTEEWDIFDLIRETSPELRLTMRIHHLYYADSPITIAENWLKAWYISESLAGYASMWKCDFRQIEDGDGEF